MVVGTVFIMVFGMATVSLVESVDDTVKNAEYDLSDPEVIIVSVTDKEEATGPGEAVAITDGGTGYTNGATCGVTGSSGSALQLVLTVDGGNAVTGASVLTGSEGSGYTDGETITINCGGADATAVIDIHDQNTVTIKNVGSDTVELSHIFITLSDTSPVEQGEPFSFTSHYSGTNLYLFPGEELSTTPFPLDPTNHGFAMGSDPDRAFLSIYDYNDAMSVTIS
jgi:hypothetical protein